MLWVIMREDAMRIRCSDDAVKADFITIAETEINRLVLIFSPTSKMLDVNVVPIAKSEITFDKSGEAMGIIEVVLPYEKLTRPGIATIGLADAGKSIRSQGPKLIARPLLS